MHLHKKEAKQRVENEKKRTDSVLPLESLETNSEMLKEEALRISGSIVHPGSDLAGSFCRIKNHPISLIIVREL